MAPTNPALTPADLVDASIHKAPCVNSKRELSGGFGLMFSSEST